MSLSHKPLEQIPTQLEALDPSGQALVAAIAEQVRAQLQAEYQLALAQREAEVRAQVTEQVTAQVTQQVTAAVTATVTAEVTARLKAEHFQQLQKLYEELRLQRRRMFGVRSEAHVGQYLLFNEVELALAEAPDAPEVAELPAPQVPEAKPPKARGKRQPITPELPRITIVHELPENERLCPCGTPMVEIGRDVSEQLDIIPLQVRVLRHERVRYACPDKTTAPRTAPLPPQILPRSNASPNLLAMLLTVKYVDGLPLARFAKVMERSGVTLPRQTQARWVIEVAQQLQPLANLILDHLLECRVLHMDETTVQVLKEPDRKATTKSYMWVMCSGARETKPLVLYDYRTRRSGQTVREKLAGWQGHLMADDYSGYNVTQAMGGVVRLTCLAHVRRYFVKAQQAQLANKVGLADEALAHIGELYRIERELDKQNPVATLAQRDQARKTHGRAAYDKLVQWYERVGHTVLPSTQLGKALTHLGKTLPLIQGYLEAPELPIDNNKVENAIRPFVVGRKGWLFSDTPAGAHASAVVYSLAETAKANGLEPYTWFAWVLKRLPLAKTAEDYEALMPWNLHAPDLVREAIR